MDKYSNTANLLDLIEDLERLTVENSELRCEVILRRTALASARSQIAGLLAERAQLRREVARLAARVTNRATN